MVPQALGRSSDCPLRSDGVEGIVAIRIIAHRPPCSQFPFRSHVLFIQLIFSIPTTCNTRSARFHFKGAPIIVLYYSISERFPCVIDHIISGLDVETTRVPDGLQIGAVALLPNS